jgi:hypothetical protein
MAQATKAVDKADADAALKSSLYGKALTTLKAKHKDEFDSILAGLYNEKGLTYNRRLSPEERKRKELNRLAAELGVTVVTPEADEPTA